MESISTAYRNLLGLPRVQAEDSQAVFAALELTAHGLDFTDALHLTGTPRGTTFCSFDVRMVRRARRAGVSDVSLCGDRR
jgi:hypothetical protein